MLHTPNRQDSPACARHSRLVLYVTVAYTLLVVYASLYPLNGWRSAAEEPFAFVLAPWPRYYTLGDLLLNVAGYLPLGFLLALVLRPYLSVRSSTIFSSLSATLLSLGMEALQNFMPPRVPSNLDVLCNGLGALAGGALAVTVGERWFLGGYVYAWRERMFLLGARIDAGFLLLLLWLFTQLNPEIWLFGTGEVGYWRGSATNFAFSPESYRWIQTGVAAANLAAICLLTTVLARSGRSVAAPLLGLISAALLLKSIAAMTLFKPGDAALWLTPGSMLGIPVGIAGYLVLSQLPRRAAAGAAALLLVMGVVLLNVAPLNPYVEASVQKWRHGHFLSFEGMTEMVSAAWPFSAVAYLCWICVFPERPSASVPSRPAGADRC
jgi:VanZ family protein